MKILMISHVYNELPLLKLKLEYCQRNHIDLYIIDNMSNDGTKEWIEEHSIMHSFVDTDDTFDLRPLLAEKERVLHELKPDWFIYASADLFFMTEDGVWKTIEKSDKEGYNKIRMAHYTFYYTGETRKSGNPFQQYFYYKLTGNHPLICKYHPSIKIIPDQIVMDDVKIKDEGICFEMQAGKTIESRMETLQRRKKAWEKGMEKGWGTHYLGLEKINFTFDKKDCFDIRQNHSEYGLFQRLQDL